MDGAKIGTPITAKLHLYGDDGRLIDKEANFIPMGYLKPTGSEIDNEAFMRPEYAKELSKKEYYDGLWLRWKVHLLLPIQEGRSKNLGLLLQDWLKSMRFLSPYKIR